MPCCVLGLVEHDDSVVQGASAHERERSDAYHARLHVFFKFGGRKHIFEGVIKRLKIRVDLVLHVAWQKAELLTCFDSRTR